MSVPESENFYFLSHGDGNLSLTWTTSQISEYTSGKNIQIQLKTKINNNKVAKCRQSLYRDEYKLYHNLCIYITPLLTQLQSGALVKAMTFKTYKAKETKSNHEYV